MVLTAKERRAPGGPLRHAVGPDADLPGIVIKPDLVQRRAIRQALNGLGLEVHSHPLLALGQKLCAPDMQGKVLSILEPGTLQQIAVFVLPRSHADHRTGTGFIGTALVIRQAEIQRAEVRRVFRCLPQNETHMGGIDLRPVQEQGLSVQGKGRPHRNGLTLRGKAWIVLDGEMELRCRLALFPAADGIPVGKKGQLQGIRQGIPH